MSEILIGVDVGGTKVAAGIVTPTGEVQAIRKAAMNPTGTAEQGLACVRAAIDLVMADSPGAGISAIGICSPGPLDPFNGVVINPPNLPCWHGFHLAEVMRDAYSVPVRVDNDANAAALAEARWGAGQGYKNVFYATLGTGIGTGIILD